MMNLFKSVSVAIFVGAVMAVPRLHAARFQSHEKEINALLAKMTLDEKIGQMVQPDLNCVTNLADIQQYGFGSMLNGGNSKPAAGNTPEIWRQTCDELQSWALKTRLKIPLIYGIDAVHGNNDVDGTVIFPHHIGMGATR
ncbi:MAG TPA: glycoside hydrolase family 3 N-terminal domain-containing protein, partial [Verrucomicrobiae bacterium]